MGAPGLRKERDAGRLQTEMIAGKEYTTLAAIQKMRELCRVVPKPTLAQQKTAQDVYAATALEAVRAKLKRIREGK